MKIVINKYTILFLIFVPLIIGCNFFKARQMNNEAIQIFNNGHTEKAINILDSILDFAPTYLTAFNNLGYIHESVGNTDTALHYYSYAIKIMPEFEEALHNRGNLYYNLGKEDLAYIDFMKAYKLGFQNKNLFNSLSLILRKKGQLEFALELINKALVLDNNYATSYDNKAMILTDLNMKILQYPLILQKHPDIITELGFLLK